MSEVHLQPVLLGAAEQGGELGQGGLPLGVRVVVQGGQQLLLFPGGEQVGVGGAARHEGDAAVFARGRAHRYPGGRQGVNLPVDGTHRYLEHLGQLRSGDAVVLQQQGENLNESIGGHSFTS